MTKPFTLQPLVNLAQQQNEAATKRLGQLNHQHQTAQEKMNALQQFRKDYQLKFQEAAKQGMSPADMKNFQDFIARLDQAIQQQQGVVEKAQANVQTGRSDLMDSTRKMKSFDTLAQRHYEAERKQEARTDQRNQDEISGRFAARHATDKDSQT